MTEERNDMVFKNIMVVDDNPIDRYIAEKTIRKYHYAENVSQMSSAVEALTYLLTTDEKNMLPEIILLDINMPEMNGFEFLDKYAALPETLRNKITVFMLSTSLNEDDISTAERNPFVTKFLNKPLNEATLHTIRAIVKPN